MDILAAEISAKRKQLDQLVGGKKFIKRAELEEASLSRPKINEHELEEHGCKEDSIINDQPFSNGAKPERILSKENVKEKILDIPEDDLARRLRTAGQPIRLFGETKRDRLARLKKFETNNREVATDKSVNLHKEAINEINSQIMNELLGAGSQKHSRTDAKADKIKQMVQQYQHEFSRINMEYMKADKTHCYTLIFLYLNKLLLEWESDLNCRSVDEKQSVKGKQEMTVFKQASEHIKPLFKLLKKNNLEADVEEKLTEILFWTLQKDYVRANDTYMKLSIGNACWPIGVGATGIHMRSAREKIQQPTQSAHVLNDEQQRKWVQSVKRLVTFAQRKYPSSDPTKMVG